ncbi:MAG: HD domain-containing protein [Ruminococcaceae bacterium]|nr:HD domain-containing protein [Oscillospiraceae bacterium]
MFSEKDIDSLRADISAKMSGYRLKHTLGVEDMAVRLGELYAPEKINILRVAALLHDVTKENSLEKQLQICENLGIIISSAMLMAPKTLHAVTAAAILPSEYPTFAIPEVIDAVRWHTTGRADMSICEKLIYLADYIEDNRTFEDCVLLREYFFGTDVPGMSASEREEHLDKTLVLSFDLTIKQLISEGTPIDEQTCAARNSLLKKLK